MAASAKTIVSPGAHTTALSLATTRYAGCALQILRISLLTKALALSNSLVTLDTHFDKVVKCAKHVI